MSDDICAICLEELLGSPVQLQKCGHSFHYSCITEWYKNNNSCPYCRCIVKNNWDTKSNLFNILSNNCKIVLNNNNIVFKNKNKNKEIKVHFVQIKSFCLHKKKIIIYMKINNKLSKYNFKFKNNQENDFYIAFNENLTSFIRLHNI